jgi:hypothetical protein
VKKNNSGYFILFFLVVFSCKEKDAYDPSRYLSQLAQDSLVYSTLRYSAKLPPTATHATKFDQAFDRYYRSLMPDYKLECYYPNDSVDYFLITRQARSVTPMREGIGGKIKIDPKGNVLLYEEIFRTWKMNVDSLEKRGKKLFDVTVKREDLSQYYTQYKRDRYIEYPDNRFYFDKTDRRWHDKELDSLIRD